MTTDDLMEWITERIQINQKMSTGSYYSDPDGLPAYVFEADGFLKNPVNFTWISELCGKRSGIDNIFIIKKHGADCNELKDVLRASGIARGCIYCLPDTIELSDVAAITLWRKEIEHILIATFYCWRFWQDPVDGAIKVSYQA